MADSEQVRRTIIADFDQIAQQNSAPVWNHNIHYYPHMLRLLPPHPQRILDVGCGNGDLVRRLAALAPCVEGLDFSPGMIAAARTLTPADRYPQVRYTCTDVMEAPLEEGAYDAIVSAATVHHLPLRDGLCRLHRLLKPHGRLIILDLYQPTTAGEMLLSLAAIPANLALHWYHCHSFGTSKEEAALWEAHGRHDEYQSIRVIREQAEAVFPNVVIRPLLLWRYLLCAEKATEHHPGYSLR